MPLEVTFNRVEEWSVSDVGRRLLERAARAALESRGPREGEVSFTFVPADEIEQLNRRYLGREHPTDVIAFRLGEEERLLGDVYISPEVAAEQAAERGETHARELLRLVIHGGLHVIGLDHPEGAERETSEMFALQERLLRSVDRG